VRFLEAMDAYAAKLQTADARDPLRRPEHRAHGARRAPEGTKAAGDRPTPEERAILERIISRGLVDVGRARRP
jgi:exodeoxyribonuclease-3